MGQPTKIAKNKKPETENSKAVKRGISNYFNNEDSTAQDILELLDPTGISSYDDVYRSYKKNGLLSWQTGLEVAGALPVIGKAGKLLKGVDLIKKAELGKKSAKALNLSEKIDKIGDLPVKTMQLLGDAGRTISNASRGGKTNPVSLAFKGLGYVGDGVAKSTKYVAKNTGKVSDAVNNTIKGRKYTNQVNLGTSILNASNASSDVGSFVYDKFLKRNK